MFAPIEPFKTDFLSVSEKHSLYYELSGNPKGLPAIFLHGGPGAGGIKGFRKLFDPEKYLIIYFDQRGCGKSKPSVSEDLDLSDNNTQELINDIEKLRRHLKIDSWLVTGGSWGTTLALAYAQAHSDRVLGVVVSSITTTAEDEVRWITEDMGKLFPKQWDVFSSAVSEYAGVRLIDKYYTAITSSNKTVRDAAIEAWCKWEDTHVSLDPHWKPMFTATDKKFNTEFATLVVHYWKHSGFLSTNPILKNLDKLKNIPGVMFHGKFDVSSPLSVAWQIQKLWPKSQLIVIEDEGHGGPKMYEAMCEALSKFYNESKT